MPEEELREPPIQRLAIDGSRDNIKNCIRNRLFDLLDSALLKKPSLLIIIFTL